MQPNYPSPIFENRRDASPTPPRASLSPEAALLRLLVPVIVQLLKENHELNSLRADLDEQARLTGEILRLLFRRIERLEGNPTSEVLQ
ncbi:MAG: hypothetical protein ACLQU2_01200 [Candidatus Binataceae bacterium]